MRKAEDFVADYRERGYDDERIRVLASMAREPLRSQVLDMLHSANPAMEPPAAEDYKPPRRGSPKVIKPIEAEAPEDIQSVASLSEPEAAAVADSLEESNIIEQENNTAMEKEIARLKAELAQANKRISELEEETALVSEHTELVDELNEEVGRSRTREAELQTQINDEKHDRREAEKRADELAEQAKELNGTLNHLRSVLADKEKQLAGSRGRLDDDEMRVKRDLETECRRLKRRTDYYRKLAIAGTAAAGIIFMISIIATRVGGSRTSEPLDGSMIAAAGDVQARTGESATSREAGTSTTRTASRDAASASTTTVQRPRPINAGDGDLTAVTGTPARTTGTPRQAPSQPTSPSVTVATFTQQTQPAPQPARPSTITYEVKRGDSLWIICRDVLGDPGAVNRVARENNLRDPSRLQPGMKLTLTVASND